MYGIKSGAHAILLCTHKSYLMGREHPLQRACYTYSTVIRLQRIDRPGYRLLHHQCVCEPPTVCYCCIEALSPDGRWSTSVRFTWRAPHTPSACSTTMENKKPDKLVHDRYSTHVVPVLRMREIQATISNHHQHQDLHEYSTTQHTIDTLQSTK